MASPSAVPTAALYVPALATPLQRLDLQDDPMSRYYQSDLSPEEKATQLRIYTFVSEHLNEGSPVHSVRSMVRDKLYVDGVTTSRLQQEDSVATEWTPHQMDTRNAGFAHQVTGIYCPMRAQTLKALDDGKAHCWYTGNAVKDGEPVGRSAWTEATGLVWEDPEEVSRIDVKLAKDGGIYKVDGYNMYVNVEKQQ